MTILNKLDEIYTRLRDTLHDSCDPAEYKEKPEGYDEFKLAQRKTIIQTELHDAIKILMHKKGRADKVLSKINNVLDDVNVEKCENSGSFKHILTKTYRITEVISEF